MREDPVLAPTLAGAALINFHWAAQFALVVMGSMLVSFLLQFCYNVVIFFPLKTHLKLKPMLMQL